MVRENCLYFCGQMRIVELYGCYSMFNPGTFNASPCTNKTIFDQVNAFFYNEQFQNNTICNSFCPDVCERTIYDVSVSTLDYPTYQYYQKSIKKNLPFFANLFGTSNITYDMFKNSFVPFGFYFNQLKYTEVVESPAMTAINLIGNVDGTMGLFTGFSLMVIVEFIEILIKLIYFFKSRKEQSQQPDHPAKLDHINMVKIN